MADYVLSRKAAGDFRTIARESLAQWGEAQAEIYLRSLFAAVRRLAEFPELGRSFGTVSPGLLRMASGSHVIFCRQRAGGVRIIRILHERMDFLRHLT